MATLHPQLAQDCIVLGHLTLSTLLLNKDANYPWFILVPDRDRVYEIYQLSEYEQTQLTKESAVLAHYLATEFQADKINIAALGNIVPQLHVHHIARYTDDAAWPAPVWGTVPSKPYSDDDLEILKSRLKSNPMKMLTLSI